MEVATDTSKTIQDVTTQVLVNRDDDIVSFGFGLTDEADGNYTQLFGAFNSKDPRYGYGSAELDAAIDSLRTGGHRYKTYRRVSQDQ